MKHYHPSTESDRRAQEYLRNMGRLNRYRMKRAAIARQTKGAIR